MTSIKIYDLEKDYLKGKYWEFKYNCKLDKSKIYNFINEKYCKNKLSSYFIFVYHIVEESNSSTSTIILFNSGDKSIEWKISKIPKLLYTNGDLKVLPKATKIFLGLFEKLKREYESKDKDYFSNLSEKINDLILRECKICSKEIVFETNETKEICDRCLLVIKKLDSKAEGSKGPGMDDSKAENSKDKDSQDSRYPYPDNEISLLKNQNKDLKNRLSILEKNTKILTNELMVLSQFIVSKFPDTNKMEKNIVKIDNESYVYYLNLGNADYLINESYYFKLKKEVRIDIVKSKRNLKDYNLFIYGITDNLQRTQTYFEKYVNYFENVKYDLTTHKTFNVYDFEKIKIDNLFNETNDLIIKVNCDMLNNTFDNQIVLMSEKAFSLVWKLKFER
jgi:hypothetical protein